jgi:hypothetical protein
MEPLIVILAPGVIGGLLVAVFLIRFQGDSTSNAPAGRLDPPSTSLINMARIRVAGGGGLGMVAMATVVAIFVPRIRFSMIVGLVLGAVLATALIAYRRRQGSWSSGGQLPGAHSLLAIDMPVRRATSQDDSAGGPAWPVVTSPAS